MDKYNFVSYKRTEKFNQIRSSQRRQYIKEEEPLPTVPIPIPSELELKIFSTYLLRILNTSSLYSLQTTDWMVKGLLESTRTLLRKMEVPRPSTFFYITFWCILLEFQIMGMTGVGAMPNTYNGPTSVKLPLSPKELRRLKAKGKFEGFSLE